jgi:hypothetical protein
VSCPRQLQFLRKSERLDAFFDRRRPVSTVGFETETSPRPFSAEPIPLGGRR